MKLLQDLHRRAFQRTHKMSLPGRTWTSPKRLYNENVPDQDLENLAGQTLCGPAQSKYTRTQEPFFMRELNGKMARTKTGTTPLPAQSRCTWTWTCHKGHFRREKYRASGNAHGHVTRAIFLKINNKMPRPKVVRETLREPAQSKCIYRQEKCRGPEHVPWSNPGLNSYRKNPSVWTHCSGKYRKGLSQDMFVSTANFPWPSCIILFGSWQGPHILRRCCMSASSHLKLWSSSRFNALYCASCQTSFYECFCIATTQYCYCMVPNRFDLITGDVEKFFLNHKTELYTDNCCSFMSLSRLPEELPQAVAKLGQLSASKVLVWT